MIPGPRASALTGTLRLGIHVSPASTMRNRRFSSGRHGEPHDSLGRQESRTQRGREVSNVLGRQTARRDSLRVSSLRRRDLRSSYGALLRNLFSVSLLLCFSAGIMKAFPPGSLHGPGEGSHCEPRWRDSGGRAGIPRAQCDLCVDCPSGWRVRMSRWRRDSGAMYEHRGIWVVERQVVPAVFLAGTHLGARPFGNVKMDSRLNPAGMTAGLRPETGEGRREMGGKNGRHSRENGNPGVVSPIFWIPGRGPG